MKKLSTNNFMQNIVLITNRLYIKENEMTDIKANENGICFINNWVPLLIHEMRRCNPAAKDCLNSYTRFPSK